MNRALAATSLLLVFAACRESEATIEPVVDAKQHAYDAAIQIRAFMLAGDTEATLKDVPPELFPGGRENWQMAMDGAEATREGAMQVAQKMEFLPPERVHVVGNRTLCAMRWTSELYGHKARSYFLGVSEDQGQTWTFVNGDDSVLRWWRENHAELITPLEPEVQAINDWIYEGLRGEASRARQPEPAEQGR